MATADVAAPYRALMAMRARPSVERVIFEGALAALVAVVLSCWVLFATRPLATGMGQDFTTMYVGAIAWLDGIDPYSTNAPAAIARSLHVMQQGVVNAPLALLLDAPLTLLQPKAAFLVFDAIQYGLAAAGAWLLTSPVGLKKRVLLTLAVVASPATFLVGYYGQIGAMVFFFVGAGVSARQRQRWALVGLCVACAFVKPQLGLCVALPLLWGAPKRAYLAALAGGICSIVITLLMLGPSGLTGYAAVMWAFNASAFARHNVDSMGVTSLYRGWAPPAWSSALTIVLAIALAGALIVTLTRHRRRPQDHALATISYLGILLLPYSHQYDSIALLPALFLARQNRPGSTLWRWVYRCGAAVILVTPLMAITSYPFTFRLLPLGLGACAISLMQGTSVRTATFSAGGSHGVCG